MKIVYYYIDKCPKTRIGQLKYQLKKNLIGLPTVYKLTSTKSKAKIIVNLVSQNYINRICPSVKGLSCSFVGGPVDLIYFSLQNWDGASKFEGSLTDYRRYLILHEFLHCQPHYLKHPTAHYMRQHCSKSRPFPIMYQQTRGKQGYKKCKFNAKMSKIEFTFR